MRKLRSQTPRLFNWTDTLREPGNEKRLSGLINDWPEYFKTKILPVLPVSLLIPFFKANVGRPSKDLLTMLGLYILQEMWDLTDVEVLRSLKYDECFQWALDIQERNDTTLYVSPKTLYNFRRLIKEKDLESAIFNQTIRDLINQLEVDYIFQCLDSDNFNTKMKRRTCLGVMTKTMVTFLMTLKRVNPEAFKTVDQNLIDRYLKSDGDGINAFDYVKPSVRGRAMLTVAGDIFSLITSSQANLLVAELVEFKLLERVFRDQCQVSVDEKIQPGLELVLRNIEDVDLSVTLKAMEFGTDDRSLATFSSYLTISNQKLR
ncbi:MAG: transposase [Deltaproteobacteria bacterium]|jgi:hypothetical protein|nr:transposase [Deltaproteobacteria bacterium]